LSDAAPAASSVESEVDSPRFTAAHVLRAAALMTYETVEGRV
jgi:hypothetical protein